jgi:hypothetical protein
MVQAGWRPAVTEPKVLWPKPAWRLLAAGDFAHKTARKLALLPVGIV